MLLTRRVQVYISQEASDALDRLVKIHGSQTKAIETALLGEDGACVPALGISPVSLKLGLAHGEALTKPYVLIHDDDCGEVLDAKGICPKCGFPPDMQSIALVKPKLPLSRTNATPLPKPGKRNKKE